MDADRQPRPGEGRATWEYDRDKGVHVPVCSRYRWRGSQVSRCRRRLVTPAEVEKGECSSVFHVADVVSPSEEYL